MNPRVTLILPRHIHPATRPPQILPHRIALINPTLGPVLNRRQIRLALLILQIEEVFHLILAK